MRRRRTNLVCFLVLNALLNWLSCVVKFLNDNEEEKDDTDWHHPITPSDSNDEATNLCASAATRRVAWVPLHKVPDNLPWHFLMPAQGDPNLWVVHVKVQHIIHKLYKGSYIVAWLQESPHFSTLPLLHTLWQQYLSQTCNCIGVSHPNILGFVFIEGQPCDIVDAVCNLVTIYKQQLLVPLEEHSNITVNLQPYLLWYPYGWMGVLSPWVILWWHWPHLWVQ